MRYEVLPLVQRDNELPTVLRFNDLQKKVYLSRSSIDRLEKKGLFPKRIKLGANSVGWRSDEIYQWLEDRSNER